MKLWRYEAIANMTKTMKKIFMNLLLQKVGCENAQGCQLVTAAINIKSIEHFFSSFLDMLLNICQRWNDEDDNATGLPDEQNFSRKKFLYRK